MPQDRRSSSRWSRFHRAWRRGLRRSAWPPGGLARRPPPYGANAGSGRMTEGFGNRMLRLCAGLAAAWAALHSGAFFAHAQADPTAQQPAGTLSGTPSDPPPEADPLPVPARLGGAPDIAFAAYQRGYYVTAMREAIKRSDADPGDRPAMSLRSELYF